MSAECPSETTITTVELDGMYNIGDLLTCNALGYLPDYKFTGTVGLNVAVDSSLNPYPLVEGPFDLVCTAEISQLSCPETEKLSGIGRYLKRYKYSVKIHVS